MSKSNELSRLSRLTSILLKLQTKQYISVKELAEKYQVSTRTIYRDILSLEQSGVPIISVEKGFSIMEGYNIPPVMFTETEANALIIAGKIIATTKDQSLIVAFNSAIDKIKSVLRNSEKQKSNFLEKRSFIGKNWENKRSSFYLSDIQKALTNFNLLKIEYQKEQATSPSTRVIEPFAIYSNNEENWVVIAWCRLRNEFRNFRMDRIKKLEILYEKFPPHKMTLQEYGKMRAEKLAKQ